IVPLDGLMGDLEFQHELASRGIAEFVSTHHIDGFVGPPEPLDATSAARLCHSIVLGSSQFQCSHAPEGTSRVEAVLVFARLSHSFAGKLMLPDNMLVWNDPNDLAVWRLR